MKQIKHLDSDQWSEVADLIDQCITVAEIDASYALIVRDKVVEWLVKIKNKASDNGIAKKKIL